LFSVHSTKQSIGCLLGTTSEDWRSREVLVRRVILSIAKYRICRKRVRDGVSSFTVTFRDDDVAWLQWVVSSDCLAGQFGLHLQTVYEYDLLRREMGWRRDKGVVVRRTREVGLLHLM
jgi:hypothetical protein